MQSALCALAITLGLSPCDDPQEFPAIESPDRPVLYVVVNFSDIGAFYTPSEHFERMYADQDSVNDYFQENFYDRVNLVPASESYGDPNDGIVYIYTDKKHPDTFDARKLFETVIDFGAELEPYINVDQLDKDGNGIFSVDELTIAFIFPGTGYCSQCEPDGYPSILESASWGNYEGGKYSINVNGYVISRFAVAQEFGLVNIGLTKAPSKAKNALKHTLGHALFGASDRHDADGNIFYMYGWDLMDWYQFDHGGKDVRAPHMSGYSKLESNLVTAEEISTDSRVYVGALSDSSLTPDGEIKDLKRIWLDPYKVRESVLLEYRKRSGYDSAFPADGFLLTQTQSLAPSDVSAPATYRRARLQEGSKRDRSLLPGDSFELTQNESTPGMTANPVWHPTLVYLDYGGIFDGAARVDIKIEDYGPKRGHLRYDEVKNGEVGVLSGTSAWGYGDQDYGYTGTIYKNYTGFQFIDGIEVFTFDTSTVSIEIYENLTHDGSPYNLIHNENFEVTNQGWHRLFFMTPIDFQTNSSRFVSVRIQTPSEEYVLPAVEDDSRPLAQNTSYVSRDGLTYTPGSYLWRQILLLSHLEEESESGSLLNDVLDKISETEPHSETWGREGEVQSGR